MTGLPPHAYDDRKDNNTQVLNGSNENTEPQSDWLEPVPNWSEAVVEWGAAWNVHLILFATLFSLQIALTMCLTAKFCRKTLRIQIITHSLSFVCITGALRFAFFLVGPYGFEGNLSGVCSHLFVQAINPSICASYGFVQMIVVKITGIGIGSEKLRNRRSIFLAFAACFLCMLSVHGAVALDHSLKALLLLDSCLYVSWMMFMCVTFVCSGFRLSQYAWEAKQARMEFLTRQRKKAAVMAGGPERVCRNDRWGWRLLCLLRRRVRALCLNVQTRCHHVRPIASCSQSCCGYSHCEQTIVQEGEPQLAQTFERDSHEDAVFTERHGEHARHFQIHDSNNSQDLESHVHIPREIQRHSRRNTQEYEQHDHDNIIHHNDHHSHKYTPHLEHQGHATTLDHNINRHEHKGSSHELLHANIDVHSLYQDKRPSSQESLPELPMLTESESVVQGLIRYVCKVSPPDTSFREELRQPQACTQDTQAAGSEYFLRSGASLDWAKLHASESDVNREAVQCSALRSNDGLDPFVRRDTLDPVSGQSREAWTPDSTHTHKTAFNRRHSQQRGGRALLVENEMDYLLPVPQSRRSESKPRADEMRSTDSDISTSSRPVDSRGEFDLKQKDMECELDADDSQERDTNEYLAGALDLRGDRKNTKQTKHVVTNEAATTNVGLREIVHRRKQRKELSLLRRTSLLRKQLPEDEIVSAVSDSKYCENRSVSQKRPDQLDSAGDVVNVRNSDAGITWKCSENDSESDNFGPKPRNESLQSCLNWLKFVLGMKTKFQSVAQEQSSFQKYRQHHAHSSIEYVDDVEKSPKFSSEKQQTKRTGDRQRRGGKHRPRLQKRMSRHHEQASRGNKSSKLDAVKSRTVQLNCCCMKFNLSRRQCRAKSTPRSKCPCLGSRVHCDYPSSDMESSSHESGDSLSGDDGYFADNEHLDSPFRTPKFLHKQAADVSQTPQQLHVNWTTPISKPFASRKREKQVRQLGSLPVAGYVEQRARVGMAHSETTFTLLPDDDVDAISDAKFKRFQNVPSSSSISNAFSPRNPAADEFNDSRSESEPSHRYLHTLQASKQIHEIQPAPHLTTSTDDSLSDHCGKRNFRSSLDDVYANESVEQERSRTHAQNPISADLFRIRRAVMVGQVVQGTYVLTFVHMFLCLLEMYKAFGRYGVLWAEGGGGRSSHGSVGVRPLSAWPWLTFQTLCRLTEVASGYVTLGILFVVLRHRNRRRK